MTYRPDIDGLRAIAILLVLIYHGGLSLFPSGFIGVDIFFVISGFLITQIICNSIERKQFSFIAFYNRRLWRLQPVFIVFLLASALSCCLLFLPNDLLDYSRSARKATLFIANIFFNNTTTGYFSPDVMQLPLLHMWSLSIEWQCYFILPIAIFLLHKLCNKKQVLLAIIILTLLLLIYALNNSANEPAQSYYQFSSRLFEFLIGALVALLPLTTLKPPARLLNIFGLIALISLIYIAQLKQIVLGYPNLYAFSVCFATASLIAIGTMNQQSKISELLAQKPLVFIGLLSYSLYLWHWLIFSVIRYEGIPETTRTLTAAYLLCFMLAYLSWRYIEKPARQLQQMKFHYSLLLLLFTPILFTHLGAYLIKTNSGYPQRFNQKLVEIYQQLQQYDSKQRALCIGNKDLAFESQCLIGKKEAKKKGLMIGDSFSNHYWGFMDTLAKSAELTLIAHGTSSCLTLPGVYLYDWWIFKNKIYQECFDQTQHYYQLIQENHYDYVIIGQLWLNYLGNNLINKTGDQRSSKDSKIRLARALDQGLKIISSSGATPVLIKSTATSPKNPYTCFFEHIKLHQAYDAKQCDFKLASSKDSRWLNNLFKQMQAKYPSLILIDPKDIQCKQGNCAAAINGIPIYRDAGHISDYASYHLGKAYLAQYGNPLLSFK